MSIKVMDIISVEGRHFIITKGLRQTDGMPTISIAKLNIETQAIQMIHETNLLDSMEKLDYSAEPTCNYYT